MRGELAAQTSAMHRTVSLLWNAVDSRRGSTWLLTCTDVGFSPVHRPYHHHQTLISTFSGESEHYS